eukprot:gene26956-3495_t
MAVRSEYAWRAAWLQGAAAVPGPPVLRLCLEEAGGSEKGATELAADGR